MPARAATSATAPPHRAAAARAPKEIAVLDEHGTYTFADLEERATRQAHALRELGLEPGTRVAMLCRNHAPMVQSLIACAKLGADVLLLNTGMSGQQVGAVVQEHDVQLLLVDDEFAGLRRYLPGRLPRVSTWQDEHPADDPALRLDDLISDAADTTIPPPEEPGRMIVLTSGTTGTPKGARRPNPSGLGDAAAVLSRIPLHAGERILVAAPLFHTWGLAALQLGMPLRATLVLQRQFDAEAALRAISEHRCTALIAVPIMLQRILDLPAQVRARYDTTSLRIVASSGSAPSASLVTGFLEVFGPVLYNLYGSTEVSWASIADPLDLLAAPSTAGRPPQGTSVGVLDPQGVPSAGGTVGRIFVGNDMLFDGYTNGTTSDTAHALMDTGDRGYLDADGRLFVQGRDDEMIVSGGENVFPRAVEEILLALPQVADAAVIGVDDPEYGQRLAAFIVLRDGARLDADTVRGYVHGRLARFCVPRDVTFVRGLPRNATGKVLKHVLADGDW